MGKKSTTSTTASKKSLTVMSVYEALKELKMLQKRIDSFYNSKDEYNLAVTYKKSKAVPLFDGKPAEEYLKSVLSKLQSIKDLEIRYNTIKNKVAEANLSMITVDGQEYTVLNAIEYAKPNGRLDDQIRSIRQLISNYNNALITYSNLCRKVEDEAFKIATSSIDAGNSFTLSDFKVESKNIPDIILSLYTSFTKQNCPVFLEATKDIKAQLEAKCDELESLRAKLDTAITQFNISTFISF